MKDFDFTCRRCGAIVLSDEVCPHGNCQNCQVICCEPPSKQIEFERVIDFGLKVANLRDEFPEFAREIDKMHFDVGKNHLRQCGHATCDCQTLTFEDFHLQRNISFGRTARAKG